MNVAQFRHLMGQSVTVNHFTGRDGYGEAEHGAAVTYRARVVGRIRTVRSASGEEVVSTQTVYLMSAAAVSPLDKLTLSTGWTNSTEADRTAPPILATTRYPGRDGRAVYTAVHLA